MTVKNLIITQGKDGYTTLAWEASLAFSFVYADAIIVSSLNEGVYFYRGKFDKGAILQVVDSDTQDPAPAMVDPVPRRYAFLVWSKSTAIDCVGYRVYVNGVEVASRDNNSDTYIYNSERLESGINNFWALAVDESGNISEVEITACEVGTIPPPTEGITVSNGSTAGKISIAIVKPDDWLNSEEAGDYSDSDYDDDFFINEKQRYYITIEDNNGDIIRDSTQYLPDVDFIDIFDLPFSGSYKLRVQTRYIYHNMDFLYNETILDFELDTIGDVFIYHPAPNAPMNLVLKNGASGSVYLDWEYSALGQAVQPEDYIVYVDGVENQRVKYYEATSANTKILNLPENLTTIKVTTVKGLGESEGVETQILPDSTPPDSVNVSCSLK